MGYGCRIPIKNMAVVLICLCSIFGFKNFKKFFGWVILLGSFFQKGEGNFGYFYTKRYRKLWKSDPGTTQKSALERPRLGCAFGSSCRRLTYEFFSDFWSLFDDFFGPLCDHFSETTVLMKKIDFLKTGVSPRREHHFWRSGADLEGLGSDQNWPKVLPESSKKAI